MILSVIRTRGVLISLLFGFLDAPLQSAAVPELLKPEPILLVRATNGTESLATLAQLHNLKSPLVSTAFFGVVSSQWPEGPVPVFRIEREDGQFELRRLPKRGQEYSAEPLFFALPREDETNATLIAGKWNCNAANAQRSNHSPDFELAIDGERVGGRFDPMGEYRVAFITGGTFRSNRLELTVEYINDRFFLAGKWHDGKLSGTWRAHDDMDRGKWEATRPQPPRLPTGRVVALYEWKNAAGHRRYAIEEKIPGWSRETKAICRVWQSIDPAR